MKFTKIQEKWGAMVAVLSLDVVKPFYKYMGLNIDNPDQFITLIRQVIVDNRREFEANPEQAPNLKKRMLESLSQTLGSEKAEEFEHWFNDGFVWFLEDEGVYNE